MFILLTDWASSLPNGIRLFGKKLSHGALIFIDTDNGPASFRRWLCGKREIFPASQLNSEW